MSSRFLEFRSGFSYEKALRYQGFLNESGYVGLLGFECPETITLGRAAAANLHTEVLVSPDFLKERHIELLATDRGGGATFHGPGQLVGFPIGNLQQFYGDARAVKRFTEDLLLGLAHACAALGVKSVETRMDQAGLWTSRGKLASIGLAVKDGFVFHGFSLNVKSDCLQGFQLINPCGIPACPISSLEQEGVKDLTLVQALSKIAPYLNTVFQRAGADLSETVTEQNAYADLVTVVTRSQMAIDHFGTQFDHVRNGE